MKTHFVTVYLYAQNFPDTEDQTDPSQNVRCMSCGRLLARARGRILIMANTRGPGVREVPIGVPMFEIKCGGCNLVHNIIWQ
jgi:phage FluMu protein Com